MLKRFLIPGLLLLLVAFAAAAWWLRAPLLAHYRSLSLPSPAGPPRPQPQPETYRTLVAECDRWRKRLAADHRRAGTPEARADVLKEARSFLETALPEMMRCWRGTPWDFNGTAESPGGGKIACGYFVATILRDAGFRVDRAPLAQQASQTILRTFVPKERMILRVDVPYEAFSAEVRALEPGVHIVGLDSHVGFLVVRDGRFRFLHSSGQQPWCVVDECEAEAAALRASRYRVLGNLTADPELARRWLVGAAFPTGKRQGP